MKVTLLKLSHSIEWNKAMNCMYKQFSNVSLHGEYLIDYCLVLHDLSNIV